MSLSTKFLMSGRALGAALALAAVGGGSPAVGAAQSASTMTAACAAGGMLLRQSMRAGAAASDSSAAMARRMIELQRMSRMPRASAGGAGEHMQIAFVHGWLGLRTSEVSDTRVTPDGWFVRYCDYPVVVSVEPASPAQKAGLESGDTIVAYNDVDLRKTEAIALDTLLVPGDTLRVAVRRSGRPLTLPLVVGRRPESSITQIWSSNNGNSYGYVLVNPGTGSSVVAVPRSSEAPSARPGLRVRETRRPLEFGASTAPLPPDAPLPPLPPMALTPLTFTLGFRNAALAGAQIVSMDEGLREVVGARSGVLVLRVAEGTPASESGLRSGDVIVLADGRTVESPMMLQQVLMRAGSDRSVLLRVQRRGRTRAVTLRW